jgi:glucokinase
VSCGDIVGALDIGGTHVSGGAVSLTSRAVDDGSRKRVSLRPAGSGPEIFADIVSVASKAMLPACGCLGVAVPGPFDYGAGRSMIRHKLEGLYGVDLRSELAAALALPEHAVRFLNDAEAFLLGEWWAGAASEHERAVGITLGTGLGSAFMAEGRIVHDGAGVPPRGALWELRFRGSPVEDTISSRGLLAGVGGVSQAEEAASRARAGDPAAACAFADLGHALGEFLAPWLREFEPSCLVVGGSIARSWELFGPGVCAELESIESLDSVGVARHLDDAALLGAAWYAANGR